ncbi:50S ribosomal protein L18 [Candidatus Microgenomates bacterium]|nr:MAG: 50S ribosomal protein L18 [Candidatus Microgenomates bacterium]
MANTKIQKRKTRRIRIRNKISGTTKRPRLSVFRSNRTLYAQLIDDEKRITLIGMNDRDIDTKEKNKVARSRELGKTLAEKAKTLKITQVVFDRGGYMYHGRVKALAEGMREGGILF